MKKEPRVDAYIKNAQPFAQPILKHIRELVHKACPDVEEKIKWSSQHFDYKGGPMCHMASFKEHCAFGFWKAALMKDTGLMEMARSEAAMGHMGRISSLKDLPSDKVMLGYIKEAMKLNEAGVKVSKKVITETEKKELVTPDYLDMALKKNKKAKTTFDAFSYSNKKEYITWLEDAKTEATRTKRLADAVEWMNEGKIRNWKYQK